MPDFIFLFDPRSDSPQSTKPRVAAPAPACSLLCLSFLPPRPRTSGSWPHLMLRGGAESWVAGLERGSPFDSGEMLPRPPLSHLYCEESVWDRENATGHWESGVPRERPVTSLQLGHEARGRPGRSDLRRVGIGHAHSPFGSWRQ